MKNYFPIAAASFCSALLAVLVFSIFQKPQKIFIDRNDASAMYTNYGEADPFLSGIQRTFLSSSPTDFIAAAERVTPAVVNIRAVESANYSWWGGSSFGASSGSGVIISGDGYIVTNNHVIEEGNKYQVTLNDRREYEAKLVATDPFTDLALLKIEDKNLPSLVFGNSDSLHVGEWVLAVGNPFNLESTVTAGIVSAKGRSIDILEGEYTIESFIQTDAAVNPGNSGGALVNTNGELVGINTAIITRSGKYEGYSFAIPATLVQKIIRDLRDYGEVKRGLLGIKIAPVDGQIAKELNLPSVEGVYISTVTPEGGAEDAGMQDGDVIVGINGMKIKTIPELQEQVGRLHPGSGIKVEYIRNGKRYSANVTLKDKDDAARIVVKGDDEEILGHLGFTLRELSTDERRKLRVSGVYVENIKVGSPIEKTEMDPGYIITKVGDVKVSSVQEVINEFKKKKGKEIYLEGFYENYPGEYYYTFEVK
ncbi:MAG: trypsin-like peptidase domain-containing protein [Bacteroidetes bacterium]|nr:trypsin-like peptidase domain-containing protein [Bacteroidota bacterium]